MDNPSALHLVEVRKEFDGFTLDNVSFDLPAGYIMGFVGPNGAGKTTTIKSILGMLHPTAGQIEVYGQPIVANGKRGDDKPNIGIVLDHPTFVPAWTIAKVGSAMKLVHPQWDDQRFRTLSSGFHLDPAKKVSELSRGMSMKLSISVALSHGARLLILDEPTSGLDPIAREELTDILADFIQDERNAVLFSTHITTDLERIADYLTFINDGRIVLQGSKDGILEDFRMIHGDLAAIDAESRKHIKGIREHAHGFTGLIQANDGHRYPSSSVIEPATLEEIVVHLSTVEN